MRPLLLLAVAGPLAAQSFFPGNPSAYPDISYPRHNLTVGFGGALPQRDLRGLFGNSPNVAVGYGYRFARYFQADAGFETTFGAAGVRSFVPTAFGDLRIRDYQFLLPVGGRAILPFGRERVLIYGGAGGAYLRYSERIQQPIQNVRFSCAVCASRDGFGYYTTVGTNVFLDQARRFRFGAATRLYRGHTEGEALGDVPAVRTRDQWLHVLVEFGVSF